MKVTLQRLEDSGTYTLMREGKPLLTPARQALYVPGAALAQAIIAEWEALGDTKPTPALLPLTGFAALALDVVSRHRAEVTEELVEYGETDLACYSFCTSCAGANAAPDPTAIAASPCSDLNRPLSPWLKWAQERYGTTYLTTESIVPVAQPAGNAARHRVALEALSVWELACLAVVVKATTSLILGLAFLARAMDEDQLFTLSWLEEAHNAARWGEDAEMTAKAAALRRELASARQWRDALLHND